MSSTLLFSDPFTLDEIYARRVRGAKQDIPFQVANHKDPTRMVSHIARKLFSDISMEPVELGTPVKSLGKANQTTTTLVVTIPFKGSPYALTARSNTHNGWSLAVFTHKLHMGEIVFYVTRDDQDKAAFDREIQKNLDEINKRVKNHNSRMVESERGVLEDLQRLVQDQVDKVIREQSLLD